MMVRNLDNIPGGFRSKMISIRIDHKTQEILEIMKKAGCNVSEFIRTGILIHFEILIGKGHLKVTYEGDSNVTNQKGRP